MRRHRRYAVDSGVLQISWLDVSGKMKMTRSRALNISEGGMAVELPEAAMPQSMLRFQSDRFKLMGAGAVRHCRREGTKYIVGLEFTDGLRCSSRSSGRSEAAPAGGRSRRAHPTLRPQVAFPQ